MAKQPVRPSKLVDEEIIAKVFDNLISSSVVHPKYMTNNLSLVKTNETSLSQIICHDIMSSMDLQEKPFGDIAARLRWHRSLEKLTQTEYAKKISQKRATLNNWESGDYRLSLDGALELRRIFGLSLDFMYEGIDDALPMTLRAAWRDRS